MTGVGAGPGPEPAVATSHEPDQHPPQDTDGATAGFPRMSAGRRPLQDLPARLRCGVELDELIAQVADDRPPHDADHQRDCPHCRAALGELHEIWAPLGRVVDEPVQAPPSLLSSVMERVEALTDNNWHAVVLDPPHRTTVAAWVIALVARRAAAAVRGVVMVSGRVTPPVVVLEGDAAAPSAPTRRQQDLAAGTGVAGRTVVVSLVLTADGQAPLPELAELVRRRVIAHVRELTGLTVVEVDVLVQDVQLPPGD